MKLLPSPLRSLLIQPRFFALAAVLACAPASPVFGYTQVSGVYTTDGSQADIIAAIASATTGNIIKIPSGTFTWGANASQIFINKAVTLVGNGPGNTIVNLDATGPVGTTAVIAILAAATVEGFTLNALGSSVTAFSVGSNGFRISNITFNAGSDPDYFCYIAGGYGLIDSCNITSGGGSDELIFALGQSDSWQTANSLGGANNVFVEDCVFNGPGYVCDANANARFVVRFCTINGQMKIDGHGFASNSPRGVREVESYDNHWAWNSGGAFPEMELRGGTGMVFDNVSDMGVGGASGLAWLELTDYGYQGYWPNFGQSIINVSQSSPTIITTAAAHNLTSGWNPIKVVTNDSTPIINGTYTVTTMGSIAFTIPVAVTGQGTSGYETEEQTPVNYPITDQIGVGMDPKTGGAEPMYTFNNTQAGAPWPRTIKTVDADAVTLYKSQTNNVNATFLESDVIKADRDVFMDLTVSGSFNGTTGVGRGTKSAMLAIAPTKTGVGFWVTDEGAWNKKAGGFNGQLYAWSGTAWVLKYTPYTYPHPSRAPIAPSNLILSP